MELLRFIIAGIIGTSFMTLFSYITSYFRNNNFREPELLNYLVDHSNFLSINPRRNSSVGWLIHYVIGFLMLFLVLTGLSITDTGASFYSSLIIGVVAGVIGIIGWQVLFILTPSPPEIELKKFYLHLIIAHVIFTVSSIGILIYIF